MRDVITLRQKSQGIFERFYKKLLLASRIKFLPDFFAINITILWQTAIFSIFRYSPLLTVKCAK
jgi:hypothetical protein